MRLNLFGKSLDPFQNFGGVCPKVYIQDDSIDPEVLIGHKLFNDLRWRPDQQGIGQVSLRRFTGQRCNRAIFHQPWARKNIVKSVIIIVCLIDQSLGLRAGAWRGAG